MDHLDIHLHPIPMRDSFSLKRTAGSHDVTFLHWGGDKGYGGLCRKSLLRAYMAYCPLFPSQLISLFLPTRTQPNATPTQLLLRQRAWIQMFHNS